MEILAYLALAMIYCLADLYMPNSFMMNLKMKSISDRNHNESRIYTAYDSLGSFNLIDLNFIWNISLSSYNGAYWDANFNSC